MIKILPTEGEIENVFSDRQLKETVFAINDNILCKFVQGKPTLFHDGKAKLLTACSHSFPGAELWLVLPPLQGYHPLRTVRSPDTPLFLWSVKLKRLLNLNGN